MRKLFKTLRGKAGVFECDNFQRSFPHMTRTASATQLSIGLINKTLTLKMY